MAKIYHWGVIGLGKMAHKFCRDLQQGAPNARIHAVASRSLERSRAFAAEYGAAHAYGSYEEIQNCPGLDVVYIATPHSDHSAGALLCLEAGIPVLVEKPFAMNLAQVEAMIEKARERRVFLMEAMWTRFLPSTQQALELIQARRIGDVLGVKADFGFRAPFDPQGRLFNPALGGGSLLDIGIYPVFLALLVLGQPSGIRTMAYKGSTGVDEEMGMLLEYPGGQMAHLHSSLRSHTKTEAFIYGSEGALHLHTRWHETQSMTLLRDGERPLDYRYDYKGRGWYFEALHVMQCLDGGLQESPLLPLAFSRELMRLLDALRRDAGIEYGEAG